ncbi:MAG: TetR/AcrR family transcriptional repressor of mexAB-oprM operon [Alphaproteobacteria bacterium]|jgi:TetR/AcrR family transcriptional repressor of mexAB-oprM operon
MVRKTKEDAQKTKENILKAAAEVFFQNGVANTSLEQIAHEAGATRGAIYWHFKNKVEIFEALQQTLDTPLTDTILSDLEKNHPNPLQQLENLCVLLLTDIHTNEYKRKLLSIFFTKCDYSGEMEPLLHKQCKQKQKSLMLFEKYISSAKEKGQITGDIDPHQISVALKCYLSGIVTEYLKSPEFIDLENNAEGLVHQFFMGINPQ